MWRVDGILCGEMAKTGTTWTRHVATQVYGPRAVHNVKRKHSPMRLVPRPIGARCVGTTRPAGEWYPSFWLHCKNVLGHGPQRPLMESWGWTFREFLARATGHADRPARTPIGVLYEIPGVTEYTEEGLWSFMHRAHYADRHGAWIARELIDSCQRVEAMSELFGKNLEPNLSKPVNTRNRYHRFVDERPYEEWYDAEMLSWIEMADSGLMNECRRDVFGPAPTPLVRMG